MTYNNKTMKVYLNGALENSGTFAYDTGSTEPENFLTIGARSYDTTTINSFFEGVIDHVKVYDFEMTPAQVAWDYNRGAPAAHWKFDEGEGTTITDSSSNSNTGNFGTNEPAWTSSGKFNSAIEFTSSESDYIDVAHSDSLSPIEDVTVSAWVKLNSLANYQVIAFKPQYYWLGFYSTTGRLRADLYTSGYDDLVASSDTALSTGQWYHVTFVYDGSEMILYKNGTEIASQNRTGTRDDTYSSVLDIGGDTVSDNYYFDGVIDDIKIYNYALTPEQIKMDYNQNSATRFGE